MATPLALAEVVTIPSGGYTPDVNKDAYGNSLDGGNTADLSAEDGHTLNIISGGYVGRNAYGAWTDTPSENATGAAMVW